MVPGVVALLAPMPLELRPVVRAAGLRPAPDLAGRRHFAGAVGDRPVLAVTTGIGTRLATEAAEAVLELTVGRGGRIEHVVVVGVAGAVGRRHSVGERIRPSVVRDAGSGQSFVPHPVGPPGDRQDGALLTGDELIRDPRRLAALEREGVIALDMETAAIAATCEAQGVRWSVFRAISDVAGDDVVNDSVSGGFARPDGSPDLAAVARYLARRPWRARDLGRLARQVQRAAGVAAEDAVRAVAALG